MTHRAREPGSDASSRGAKAETVLDQAFEQAGWRVSRSPAGPAAPGGSVPDMVVRRRGASYTVELKMAAEGRGDRLVALWAQVWLQASRAANAKRPPLAVVAAPKIGARAAEQVLRFAAEYVPAAAVGVIDFSGLRLFRGPHLEGLNADQPPVRGRRPAVRREPTNLFSDLNQWMLKVLLAPELPEHLLAAPRGRYRSASQLARAADVSVMGAFRLVEQLRRDGFLDSSAGDLRLVRREELFSRWQAAVSARPVNEIPVRFLLRGALKEEMRRIVKREPACLALYAAADALRLGFVHGVPPHVYVRRLDAESRATWKNMVPAARGEEPDAIIRQASAPESVFRARVVAGDVPVSDVLQVWLAVSSHPSRGAEQANLIRRRVLGALVQGG